MILHNSTVYIRQQDKDICGGIHIANGLVVVEIEGTPTMDEIRDFITERVIGDQLLTLRNCTFMTAEDWSMMLAAEYISEAMKSSKYGWINDTLPEMETLKLTTTVQKDSWWARFWAKGIKK